MSRVLIAGGGPAGLAAAEMAAQAGAQVTLLDQMPSVARKFLMAGRGGLNITHAEPMPDFLRRYGPEAAHLAPALAAFDNAAMRDWCAGLGIETFVGSSGRVFPAQMKASPLLRAWLARLDGLGVDIRTRTRWLGGRRIEGPRGAQEVEAGAVVLALGGASWPRLGSDGAWTRLVDAPKAPFRPANCGFRIAWSAHMARHIGAPVKGAAFQHGGQTARGEAAISGYGIEGGAIYALSRGLRETIISDGVARLDVDLKPDLTAAALAAKLREKKQSMSNRLRRIGLSPAAAALARETGPLPPEPEALAARLKTLRLRLDAPAPIDRAISSAGGLRWDGVDETLMLRAAPGVFAAGEMLDWEAPTGGYLLQACIATGRMAGENAARWAAGQAR